MSTTGTSSPSIILTNGCGISQESHTLGILVGGGPAPGINGIIASATLTALDRGWTVFGIMEGFRYLMEGRTDMCKRLSRSDVSRIHNTGGTVLCTSRANPTKKPEDLQRTLDTLKRAGIDYLITIGGDDTATSSLKLANAAGDALKVCHVPKTIDNDLPLPGDVPTFGYRTAQAVGYDILRNLMADAKSSPPRWYIVVSMGRQAGHLALGMGFSAGAHLTLIPEEWGSKPVTFSAIVDAIEGTVLKRLAIDKPFGVVVLAEGLVEKMLPDEVDRVFDPHHIVSRDEHGHIRLDEVELGGRVRDELRQRFAGRSPRITWVVKNIGYELRCADPIPFDIEYTRILGSGAVRFLAGSGNKAIVTMIGEQLSPIPFQEIINPATGKSATRAVDTDSLLYKVAREFMMRLTTNDLGNSELIGRMAAIAKMTPDEFLARYRDTFAECTTGGDAAMPSTPLRMHAQFDARASTDVPPVSLGNTPVRVRVPVHRVLDMGCASTGGGESGGTVLGVASVGTPVPEK
ncbi:6-phosphofructokinase [Paratrimastix pyriformis]|uniref:Pyrophosphate--fructose 6-phosphate 1-phosphotransferase n=1 Tax=Paratrimastix pyriformis TaxID=342808 RepID=A0ABQ8UDD2_9EUKA|nr:6-phosphofructokinase [Paratrimastix pyriformis]